MLFMGMPTLLPAPVAACHCRDTPNGLCRRPAAFLKNRTVGARAPRVTEAVEGSLGALFRASLRG
jgi:hypothetical protein